MSAKLERWLIALFMLGSFGVFLATNQARPRVMILHSYGTDYSWTRDVNIGLTRVLDGKRHYAVRWHYMDLKRHPWPEFKDGAGARARRAIEEFAPDVLIAVDDDAQAHAARHFVDHPRVKIVFAGINGGIEPYGYDKAGNATGILERKHLAAVRAAIGDAGFTGRGGRPPRLLAIGDTSESVNSDMKLMERFDWKPLDLVDRKFAGTFDEWKDIVLAAEGQADVIVTTNYRKLTRAKGTRDLVPPEQVVAWTEKNSKLPLIGTNGFWVEDGGMMAIGTSGYEQGEVAAGQAIRILSGAAPRSIPVMASSQFVVYLRPNLLHGRAITLPPLYEAFARATNNYLAE